MQINVPPERVVENMAKSVATLVYENAQLKATNEVLVERLREYVQRDQQQEVPTVPSANGQQSGESLTSSD